MALFFQSRPHLFPQAEEAELYKGRYFMMTPGKRLRTRRGGGRVVWGGDACVAPGGGEGS